MSWSTRDDNYQRRAPGNKILIPETNTASEALTPHFIWLVMARESSPCMLAEPTLTDSPFPASTIVVRYLHLQSRCRGVEDLGPFLRTFRF